MVCHLSTQIQHMNIVYMSEKQTVILRGDL